MALGPGGRGGGGWDLAQLWRERRWRFLLNLIDHLPTASYYKTAVADDPDNAALAALLAVDRDDEDDEAAGPSLAEWTSERQGIAQVQQALHLVVEALYAVNGGEATLPTVPLPVTAVARAQQEAIAQAGRRTHAFIAATVLGLPQPD